MEINMSEPKEKRTHHRKEVSGIWVLLTFVALLVAVSYLALMVL